MKTKHIHAFHGSYAHAHAHKSIISITNTITLNGSYGIDSNMWVRSYVTSAMRQHGLNQPSVRPNQATVNQRRTKHTRARPTESQNRPGTYQYQNTPGEHWAAIPASTHYTITKAATRQQKCEWRQTKRNDFPIRVAAILASSISAICVYINTYRHLHFETHCISLHKLVQNHLLHFHYPASAHNEK